MPTSSSVCDESATALGFKPSCDIAGAIDSAVDEPTGGHVLLCLREALSNVARHADASRVAVNVVVDDGRLTLRVADDGVGYRPTAGQHSSGLDNMRVRAESLGGDFSIEALPDRGTVTTWTVPITRQDSAIDEIGSQGPN